MKEVKETKVNIIRVSKNKENPYVMLNKTALNDARLSMRGKGLHSYLLSLPDDWDIYISELTKHFADGRDSVANAITELILHGYMTRTSIRDDRGYFKGYNYSVFEVPIEVCEEIKNDIENKKQKAKIRNDKKRIKNANKKVKSITEISVSSENGQSDFGQSVYGQSATTNNNKLNNNILNNKNTTTSAGEEEPKTVVVDEEILNLKAEIETKIKTTFDIGFLKTLLDQVGEEEIRRYLESWDKFTPKKNAAGLFYQVVKTKAAIPELPQQQYNSSSNKPMADFKQRKYSDEFYQSLYVNFDKEAEG